jgi:hypothetical protein
VRRDNGAFVEAAVAPPAAAALVGMTLDGVKELRDEVLQCATPIESTGDISENLIKSKTKGLPPGGRAYVNTSGGRHRGRPTHFVSHTWLADAHALLESIIAHGDRVVAGGGVPPVYYLDLVSVDQHLIDQVRGAAAPRVPLRMRMLGSPPCHPVR